MAYCLILGSFDAEGEPARGQNSFRSSKCYLLRRCLSSERTTYIESHL